METLLNMLSRLVITFLPRTKHLLISWLQSPSAVILEPKKIWKIDSPPLWSAVLLSFLAFSFCFGRKGRQCFGIF